MTDITVEIANITLKKGVTEEQLMEASQKLQNEFVDSLKGFISRELVHLYENQYADIIHWETREDAEKAMEQASSSTACMEFFSLMEMDEANPDEGLLLYRSIASYKK